MNEGDLILMCESALVMQKLLVKGGVAVTLLPKCHLPLQAGNQNRKLSCSLSVIPDGLNRESILAFSSPFLKKTPHKNLKTTRS